MSGKNINALFGGRIIRPSQNCWLRFCLIERIKSIFSIWRGLMKIVFILEIIALCAQASVGMTYDSSSCINDALQTQGFFEIANRQFVKNDYDILYKEYDHFIELMSGNTEILAIITQSETEFFEIEGEGNRYCSAPPSYRDPMRHAKKINNRIYFQFIKEHYDLLLKKYPQIFRQDPSLGIFFETLLIVDRMAKEYFTGILDNLEKIHPTIKGTMYGAHRELTVITKIVRYQQIDDWHEKPHFDKSGLTLIWDSDDDNHDSLMVCSNSHEPKKEALKLPHRFFGKERDISSTLLITGLCLGAAGYDLKPTLHYVGPIKNKYRHSLISFLLVPDIDTKALKTEFH